MRLRTTVTGVLLACATATIGLAPSGAAEPPPLPPLPAVPNVQAIVEQKVADATDDLTTLLSQPLSPESLANCQTWDPKAGSLQAMVDAWACVSVPKGTHQLTTPLRVPGGHVLRGADGTARNEVVLQAKRNVFWPHQIGVVKSATPFHRPVVVTGLTVDGNSQVSHRFQNRNVNDGAHVGISAPSMVVHDVEVRNARCVGISAYESLVSFNLFTTVVSSSTVHHNGFECLALSAPPGSGIYIHPVGEVTDRILLLNNTIRDNDGSGIDIYGVDGGVMSGNTVVDNSVVDGFAAITIGDASNWVISGNTAINPKARGKRNCPGSPAGDGGSGLFLCALNQDVTGNVVMGNTFSSWYGVLVNHRSGRVLGNVFRDNTVRSLGKVRCAEASPEGANTWEGNTCGSGEVATVTSEPPLYFTTPRRG